MPRETATIAGAVDESIDQDSYGLNFASGFADVAFAGDLHDMVVALESASGGVSETIRVPCDHFSYLEQKSVQAKIVEKSADLPMVGHTQTEVEGSTLTW